MFLSYKDHAWLRRSFARLTKADMAIALGFIKANEALDPVAFERLAVRLFMDKTPPKHWKEIEELLVCANSAIK